jgi:DNA topoisomerase I
MPRISAGRVQSVATRLIVEKERERMAFHLNQHGGILLQ